MKHQSYNTTDGFELNYIDARKKENRLLTDNEVMALPDLPRSHIHHSEWQLRKRTAARFQRYLEKKRKHLSILDLGCGNGWFSNRLANLPESIVFGIDINQPELRQAISVFKKPNLDFAYSDIFSDSELRLRKFDIIVLNSVLQYFPDPAGLMVILKEMLAGDGEIHILDTPFYRSDQIEPARLRSKKYYESIGNPQMADRYFHHQKPHLGDFEVCYKPSVFSRLMNDSPFEWIRIKKT